MRDSGCCAGSACRSRVANPVTHSHQHHHHPAQRIVEAEEDELDLSSEEESAPDSVAPDEDEDDDPVDPDEDILAGRWKFVSRYFDRWFQSSQYADHPSSTPVDLRFHSFFVFLPFVVDSSSEGDRYLRRLRDATELVGLMFQVDKNAWWYTKKKRKPWFRSFYPSNYDPDALVPKMTFVLHQRFGPGDDKTDAVKRLHYLLVVSGQHTGDERARVKFLTTKRRILDKCDPGHRLDGFKIPITIQLRPEVPADAKQLCSYLQDVSILVSAIQKRAEEASYPFRLDEIHLTLYQEHVSDAHAELSALLSQSVPVTIRLRHSHDHISLPFAWSDFGWRANVFPAFVGEPSEPVQPIHSIVSRDIHCSPELLSAVAFSSRLRSLNIAPNDESELEEDIVQAKWLAYAIKNNKHLERLTLHQFPASHAILDAMEAVVSSKDPTRVLKADAADQDSEPQVVLLKPETKIVTEESPRPQTLQQFNVSCDRHFSVVHVDAEAIELVVPGHAIVTTSISNAVSIEQVDGPADTVDCCRSLSSLVLTDAYFEDGTVPRFVRLFGRYLEELRWADSLGGDFANDIDAILADCSSMERLYLQGSSMSSLSLLTRRLASPLCQLRFLSLMYTSVPMDELVALLKALADITTRASRTLESLSYYCPGNSLNRAATEAALRMLTTNRHLQSVTLGINADIYDEFEEQFQDERDVEIVVESLPIRRKFALCSVVRHERLGSPESALARLDRACLSSVFEWFVRTKYRRVRVIQAQ